MTNVKSIIALVIFVAFMGGVYYVVTSGTIFVGPQTRYLEVQNETERLKNEIITPLNKLTHVDIDVSFFTSVEYTALDDKSVILRDPDLQRSNPFSPVAR